ncbi:MAG TPA: acetyl-CoA carboxylase biotin carboxyl carrier protein [Burkholderiaceae bacterium]|nr:acetyl-CoA carboxylase biotin carboxyl carrier protein [Burkholderiaceae bacterium]
MDLRKLKTLIDLVAESGIAEIEVTEGEDKVRIVKHAPAAQPAAAAAMPLAAAHIPAAPAPAHTPVTNGAGGQTDAAAKDPEPIKKGQVITAPMVGTFYRSASPGSAPFADVGKTIKPGDTLCIIEAMKLLNEIEAEVAGTVLEVLAENGQPVEYGQPLFVIG